MLNRENKMKEVGRIREGPVGWNFSAKTSPFNQAERPWEEGDNLGLTGVR